MPFLAHRYGLLMLAGTPRHGRGDAGIPRLYLLAPWLGPVLDVLELRYNKEACAVGSQRLLLA